MQARSSAIPPTRWLVVEHPVLALCPLKKCSTDLLSHKHVNGTEMRVGSYGKPLRRLAIVARDEQSLKSKIHRVLKRRVSICGAV